ncbi:MAG TPA: DUF4259 domain-containing protein [Candidatus Dietzia merdigallinarum]|nr:DUF4259 domain-containing protein [Candidatus Dietzia merdigallinarum]
MAAAATVASLLPGGPPVDPESGPRELADAGLRVDESLRTSAIAAVNEVLDDESEWHELWAEAGSLEEATAPVRRVLDALRQ